MYEMALSPQTSSCKAHRTLIDIIIVIININNDALKMAWEDRKRVCKAGKCALTEEVGGNLTSKSVDRGEKTRENASWHHPGTKTMAPPVSCVNHGLLCHNTVLVFYRHHCAIVLLFEDGFVYCARVADISHQFTPTFHYYLVKMMTL